MGNNDPIEVAKVVLLEQAQNVPDRVVTAAVILKEIRNRYWDYDDTDWRTALSNLIAQGIIRHGIATATIEVAAEDKAFIVPHE